MSDFWNFFFQGFCPTPTNKNVLPKGEGWYRFNGTFWVRWYGNTNANFDGRAKHLTGNDLARFAKQALKVA